MVSYRKLLGITALAAPLAFVLTKQFNCFPSEEEEKLITAIYQEEHIPLLERIIEDEAELYLQIQAHAENAEGSADDDAEETVQEFEHSVKPRLESFLGTGSIDMPPSYTGFWDGLFSPYSGLLMAAGISLLSLFAFSAKCLNRFTFLTIALFSPITPMGVLSLYQLTGNNYYEPFTNSIYLSSSESPEEAAITMTHEFTHYVQDQQDTDDVHSIMEGHARGVELVIGKELYEETGNPAYLLHALESELGDLLVVYNDLCKRFDVGLQLTIPGIEPNGAVEAHGLGTTLFMLRERQWGERGMEIYPTVLRGDYCMLLHSPAEDDCVE